MTDWQSIETAPRDGTRVLMFDGSVFIGYAAHLGDDTLTVFWSDDESASLKPTHWMPLPPPPWEGKP